MTFDDAKKLKHLILVVRQSDDLKTRLSSGYTNLAIEQVQEQVASSTKALNEFIDSLIKE